MSRYIIKWNLNDIVHTIVATLLNKYDFFCVIEGNTGTGKSTLAFHIATKVEQEFKRLYNLNEDVIEYYYERVGKTLELTEEEFISKILLLKQNKEYKFNPRKALVYTQDELQKSLASWHNISIPDEMINITFNRDFFSEKQKDIIKMINMFRDHENLTLACVPQFQNLDNQIKNLTKMKITVKKRGTAIIHTPNQTVYCKDKWDQATNEKIEREWIIKKITRPNYSKLTTFRGLVKFPPLTKKQEAMYQEIKNQKRSVVLKDDMHIKVEEKDDPFQKILKVLIDGGVKNGHVIDGYAMGMGLNPEQLRTRISRELTRLKKPSALAHYFWEGKKLKDMKHLKEEQELVIEGI
jgi:KaiC/GvpD/RAD55 family RecA-like ATPase